MGGCGGVGVGDWGGDGEYYYTIHIASNRARRLWWTKAAAGYGERRIPNQLGLCTLEWRDWEKKY